MQTIKVVLADDHEMVRQGLAQVLQDSEQILIVGQAGNASQTIALVEKTKPNVVVLDYSMPGMDCVEAIKRIRSLLPETKILILTVHENVHYAIRVLEAGVHGFVVKASAVQELVHGIKAVHNGRSYVSPVISEKLLENLRNVGRDRSGLNSLSKREFELLRLMGAGMRQQDCAKTMGVTESTVSSYRTRLLQKLDLKSTPELIRFALENGIVG